ncbi:MAG: hypothetical protein ACR2HG_04255 [Pyrinomonadaceae bacterium]
MTNRLLTRGEISWARMVFQSTLPYDQIYISDAIGAMNRAFTIPAPSAGQAAASTIATTLFGPLATPFITTARAAFYIINFGSSGYANAGSLSNLPTFIHELTHVWQSYHQTFPNGYIFNSLWHQAVSGGGAYSYNLGQSWNSYNVEQQASIVEHWFSSGMSSSNPRFTYIQNNIRTAGH